MKPFVLTDADLQGGPELSGIGGKALGLARLRALGAPVPELFVVTTDAWRASEGERPTPEIAAAIRKAVAELGEGPFAVRSSAAVEDGAKASWAGQFESVLGVDAEGVVEAVGRCWASGRGQRAVAYGAMHGTEAGPMAVVVQRLVVGEASGVMFSRTPEDPERVLISVGLGLGEGVVQGRVPCDTFRMDRRGRIERDLGDKDEETVLVDGGVATRPVQDDRRARPALRDPQVREVGTWGLRLEQDLGGPVDVEFTFAQGRLHLLQVRPVTAPVPHGRRLLWDNSNIIESYEGVTTPLTFSFASSAYTIVYQLFCQVMGVDAAVIRANEPTFRRMIGLVRGRIYYNLNAWYRVLSLLPGFSFNRAAMETMMGVSEVASDEDAGVKEARWLAGLRLVRLGGRLLWRLARLERDAAAFQATFAETLERCRSLDLDRLRPDELLELYEEIERRLLWGWTPPLVNDFFCMIFYKSLQKRCEALTGDPATQLHNRLVAGEGALASAAPATGLAELARLVHGVDVLRVPFASERPDEEVLAEALAHPGFREGWEAWMARYGDRSPNELKLEAPPLSDTPEYLLQTLRSWVRDDLRKVRLGSDAGRPEGRLAAEAEVARRIEALGGRLAQARERAVFSFVLRQARRRIAMRESLRFERTRIFGVVRRIFRAFGDRFVQAGELDARQDVFYLTVDEVLGFVRGTAASTDLRGLAALRRAEFDRYRATDGPAERFHTWGAVHLHNAFRGRAEAPPPEGDTLQGTPCSPGRVVAAACVVHDPRERPDLGGGILVAHRTDPGWVPLFPTASAVLVERGSLLSHSAVVARELGLPAVVGVRGLVDWARDGEVLGMDGSTGRIWREEAAEDELAAKDERVG